MTDARDRLFESSASPPTNGTPGCWPDAGGHREQRANPFTTPQVTAAVGRLKKCGVCSTLVFKPPKGKTTTSCPTCRCSREVR